MQGTHRILTETKTGVEQKWEGAASSDSTHHLLTAEKARVNFQKAEEG